jgi:hypothetical protein
MNVFEAIFMSQYAELKKNGRDTSKAKINGIVLVGVMLMLNFFTIVLFIVFHMHGTAPARWLEDVGDIFGSGRSGGRLMALVSMAVLCGITYWWMGSDKSYQKMIAEFETLDTTAQKAVSKKGLMYFIVSLVIFLAVFIPGVL